MSKLKGLVLVEQYLQLLRTAAALSLWAVCFFLLLPAQLALIKYLVEQPSDLLLALIGISVFATSAVVATLAAKFQNRFLTNKPPWLISSCILLWCSLLFIMFWPK